METDDLTACLALAEALHASFCDAPRVVVGREGGTERSRLEATVIDEDGCTLGMAIGRGDTPGEALRALRVALTKELGERVTRERADVESRKFVLDAMGAA